MKKSRTLAIATVLLLAISGVALGEEAAGATQIDCNPVFKAKAEAGKKLSSKQLAKDLNMPLDQVNTCLRRMRHSGPRATPPAAQ
jgi:hypothetical protein